MNRRARRFRFATEAAATSVLLNVRLWEYKMPVPNKPESSSEGSAMRIASVGHAVFAAAVIALGIVGLAHGNFAPVWDPVPKGAPGREALVYLCTIVSLACGVGLLWKRTAALSARVLLAFLLLWFILFRLPFIILTPNLGTFFGACDVAVMMAAAWVLYTWFATEWDRRKFGFISGAKGLRIARVFYGLSMIFYGTAHFMDLPDTVSLVPRWLPWHVFWAYFFGCAFIAAGAGILINVFARLAAALSAVEIGLFTLLVWVPIVSAAGPKSDFEWSETVLSFALTAAAWVVADSYRTIPGLAARER
jgi:uncharacterized membrane protein